MIISDSTSNAVLTIVIDGLNFAELAGGGIKFIYGADSSEFDHQQPLPVGSDVDCPDVTAEPSDVVRIVELCAIVHVHIDNSVDASHHQYLVVDSDVHAPNAVSGLGEDLHCSGDEEGVGPKEEEEDDDQLNHLNLFILI